MIKQKSEVPWHEKPLMERISAILYPGNTTDENRRQMQSIANAEGKKSPQQAQQEIRNRRK